VSTQGGSALSAGYARVQPGSSTVPSGIAIFSFRQGGVLVSEAAPNARMMPLLPAKMIPTTKAATPRTRMLTVAKCRVVILSPVSFLMRELVHRLFDFIALITPHGLTRRVGMRAPFPTSETSA